MRNLPTPKVPRGLSLICVPFLLLLPSDLRADDAAAFRSLIQEKAPSVVTIRFVLKVKMGGMLGSMGDSENEQEINGVMIEPDGLVLCSNTQLGGMAGMMRRMLGSMGEISANPTDLKVLISDDTEGVDAELIARDSELDLAWIRIKEPSGTPYAHVDLASTGQPEIGDKLFGLRRMGKYFDRVPVLSETRLAATTRKPRPLLIPASALGTLGLPVYTADGRVVGVSVLQMPEAEDPNQNPFGFLSSMSEMEELMTGLILPAEEVARATQRAKESRRDADPEEPDAAGDDEN